MLRPFSGLFLAAVLSLATVSPAVAKYGDSWKTVTWEQTNRITTTLTRGVKNCQRLPKVYRYDCYRQTYQDAADLMEGVEGYAEARTILLGVERSLNQTVTRNADRGAPPARLGRQQFRGISAARLPQAKSAFIDALEEAETLLLRSADSSKSHHLRIAEALNSNKVLLRSALLWLRALV